MATRNSRSGQSARSESAALERRLERLLDRQMAKWERQMQSMMTDLLQQSLTRILGGTADGTGALLEPLLGPLLGNVLSGQNLPQLARGGIIDGAQLLALGGEAGPEAVLPLDRRADGSLGVRVTDAGGGGGGGAGGADDLTGAQARPIIINIHTTGDNTVSPDTTDNPDDTAGDAMAASLSHAVAEALDQAVAARLRDHLRDGGLLDGHNVHSVTNMVGALGDVTGR